MEEKHILVVVVEHLSSFVERLPCVTPLKGDADI